MKIRDLILFEAPLPEDWNKAIFDPNVPFEDRVEYAQDRADQVGMGSSRVAFVIQYQGRKTVLKVARNNKGVFQNEEEVSVLSSFYDKKRDILIPLIDYDRDNRMPHWIQTEYAVPIQNKFQFEQYTGVTSDDLMDFYYYVRDGYDEDMEPDEDILNNSFAQLVMDVVDNFDLHMGDLRNMDNWGIYNNKVVLIDVGATNEYIATYYG